MPESPFAWPHGPYGPPPCDHPRLGTCGSLGGPWGDSTRCSRGYRLRSGLRWGLGNGSEGRGGSWGSSGRGGRVTLLGGRGGRAALRVSATRLDRGSGRPGRMRAVPTCASGGPRAYVPPDTTFRHGIHDGSRRPARGPVSPGERPPEPPRVIPDGIPGRSRRAAAPVL